MNKSLPKLPTDGESDDEDTEVMHDMDDDFEARAANMEEDDESNTSDDDTLDH